MYKTVIISNALKITCSRHIFLFDNRDSQSSAFLNKEREREFKADHQPWRARRRMSHEWSGYFREIFKYKQRNSR